MKEQRELPEDIAIPLLKAAQSEPREELQELWARLLANAMDPERAENVRPEFIETVRKLQPVDARILVIVEKTISDSSTKLQIPQLAARAKMRESATEVSVSRLESERCVRRNGGSHLIALTEFGKELMIAIAP